MNSVTADALLVLHVCVCVCARVHNVCLCAKDGFSVPFTPWRSLVPWQCFPYMHITHRCTCANTHRHTLHRAKCQVQWWGDDEPAPRHCPQRCRHYHHTGTGFSWKKKKGALDVVPSAKLNHDGVSLAASPSPPGLSYLRQAEEAHSQEKMAWGDGRACVPGIPQYTVDTLLWHLQGQLDRYSVIRVWEKVVLSVWLLWNEHSEGKPPNNRVQESRKGSDVLWYTQDWTTAQYIDVLSHLDTYKPIIKNPVLQIQQ